MGALGGALGTVLFAFTRSISYLGGISYVGL